ncbi:MAG: SDR family NAD(P)-dependent oxidoreductase [Planctomycetes bacterium]|nr:SDR family NAD(P)-dependent oxidoreductase [Planctomycetota bacterium]
MKKAIVIGATSGIGRELAKVLSENQYDLGLSGRRTNLLETLQTEIPDKTIVKFMDVSQTEEASRTLKELISEMGGADLIVLCSGTGHTNTDLDWSITKETIDVNVYGFTALANVATNYFIAQGKGHLVGISSVAAIRGHSSAPSYNASKAFQSNYLEGIRHKVRKLGQPIIVTDIQPGFVDTAMAKGPGIFWVAPARKAAIQIYKVIKKKKKHAYITKRWRLIAWLSKVLPDFIYNKI